jgi:hypothetical protein
MSSGMSPGLFDFDTPKSAPEDFVLVPNVRALGNGLSLMCALGDGRRFGVPSDCIGTQSEVRVPGDCGTLAVIKWFAEAHQLPTAA